MKHITKFFKLFKNANYRKKISKHVERNIYKCTKLFNFVQRMKKNKQIKYNTADQLVDIQAVNFVPVKHN